MYILLFILGLCVGSFINAAVYRINPAGNGGVYPKGESLVRGRSICVHCKKTLTWWQLVPLLSYAFLKGRCYNCQQSISIHYPLVELSVGIAFVLLASQLTVGEYWTLALGLIVVSILFFIALYDYSRLLILDSVIILGVITAVIWQINQNGNWLEIFLATAGLTLFFAALYFFSKGRWLGFGDVKLAIFLGILHGPMVFLVLLLASWLGTIVGLGMMASGRGNLKTELPFGTFLALTSIIVFIWQGCIAGWLTNYFL